MWRCSFCSRFIATSVILSMTTYRRLNGKMIGNMFNWIKSTRPVARVRRFHGVPISTIVMHSVLITLNSQNYTATGMGKKNVSNTSICGVSFEEYVPLLFMFFVCVFCGCQVVLNVVLYIRSHEEICAIWVRALLHVFHF